MAPQASTGSVLSALKQDYEADLKHYHPLAHMKQFAALFVASFVASITAGGWHVAGWAAVGALVVSAAGAAARQLWPQLPWTVVEDGVKAAVAAVEPKPVDASK